MDAPPLLERVTLDAATPRPGRRPAAPTTAPSGDGGDFARQLAGEREHPLPNIEARPDARGGTQPGDTASREGALTRPEASPEHSLAPRRPFERLPALRPSGVAGTAESGAEDALDPVHEELEEAVVATEALWHASTDQQPLRQVVLGDPRAALDREPTRERPAGPISAALGSAPNEAPSTEGAAPRLTGDPAGKTWGPPGSTTSSAIGTPRSDGVGEPPSANAAQPSDPQRATTAARPTSPSEGARLPMEQLSRPAAPPQVSSSTGGASLETAPNAASEEPPPLPEGVRIERPQSAPTAPAARPAAAPMSAAPESMLFTFEFDAGAARIGQGPGAGGVAPSLLSQLAAASRQEGPVAPFLPSAMPDEVSLLIHDPDGDIKLDVGRQDRDVAVRIEVPSGLFSALREAEAPIRSSLHEEGYELEHFELSAREDLERSPEREQTERHSKRRQAAAHTRRPPDPPQERTTSGPRLLNRRA
jgi:hypothetical protein